MLVLSRKAGERINIGSEITVEVRRVSGNRVTIALHAPKEVRILRGELKKAAQEFEVIQESTFTLDEVSTMSSQSETAILNTMSATA